MIYEDDDGFLKWMDSEWLSEDLYDCCNAMAGLHHDPYYTEDGGCSE